VVLGKTTRDIFFFTHGFVRRMDRAFGGAQTKSGNGIILGKGILVVLLF
jgi:hypothetical protein